MSTLIYNLGKVALLTFTVLAFSSCQSFKTLPPDYSGDSVTFGTGGGFVGREIAHVLLDNGEVFSVDHQMNFTSVKKLSQNDTRQLFSNIDVMGLMDWNYMRPGNTYAFIEIKRYGRVNRLSWDDMNRGVPEEVLTYYRILNSHIE